MKPPALCFPSVPLQQESRSGGHHASSWSRGRLTVAHSAFPMALLGLGTPDPRHAAPGSCHQAQHLGSDVGQQAVATEGTRYLSVRERGANGHGTSPGNKTQVAVFPGSLGLKRVFLEMLRGELCAPRAWEGSWTLPGWAGTRAST